MGAHTAAGTEAASLAHILLGGLWGRWMASHAPGQDTVVPRQMAQFLGAALGRMADKFGAQEAAAQAAAAQYAAMAETAKKRRCM